MTNTLGYFKLFRKSAKLQNHLLSHGFELECTRKVAKKNHKLLAKFDYDYEELVQAHTGSIIRHGSEFKTTSTLRPLLEKHHDWKMFQAILDDGADYPMKKEALLEHDLEKVQYPNLCSG